MEHVFVHPPSPRLEGILHRHFDGELHVRSLGGDVALRGGLAQTQATLLFAGEGSLSAEGDGSCENGLRHLRRDHPTLGIVVVLPEERSDRAPALLDAGATDILPLPTDPEAIRILLGRLHEGLKLRRELVYLRDQSWEEEPLEVLESACESMQKVLNQIRSVAPTRSTVLLTGDSGTGKSLLARLIHRRSHRRGRPFINVHCGALPENLVESELFGHERGAFTGAETRRLGKFELAHQGTLFLDEIGTITPATQIKLLQVLQERSFTRLGGGDPIAVDVRIIAATNADLEEEVRHGRFRQDLYYRLAVFPVHIPPLRERRQDIPQLARSFLERMQGLYGKNVASLHEAVEEALQNYPWPGNVRELENVLERAFVLEQSEQLTLASLPADVSLRHDVDEAPLVLPSHPMHLTLAEGRIRCIEGFERQYLTAVLARNHGRIDRSAQEAGISVRQLHKLLTRYEIHKEDFKLRSPAPPRERDDE